MDKKTNQIQFIAGICVALIGAWHASVGIISSFSKLQIGDCCVFCSYGSNKCPPKQPER